MKFIVIAQHDPNVFSNMYLLARQLADAGDEVIFLSPIAPRATGVSSEGIDFIQIPTHEGLAGKLPLIRSNYHTLISVFLRERPDWIIAQHEYIVPATLYRILPGSRARVAACFVDFHGARRYVQAMKPLAGAIDAYVDVCDMRVEWQKEVWPRMTAPSFVVRTAPLRQTGRAFEAHDGAAKVVLTASAPMILKVADPARFSRFATRLCERGVSLSWYIIADDKVRAAARALCTHPLFKVLDPLPKAELVDALRGYDVGLFWSPMADCDPTSAQHRSVFISAASNKIAEYIAAGLMVAHTGNPGLAYLPQELCIALDGQDPQKAADRLVAAIANRSEVERRRRAALCYHQSEMNFEAQVAPFLRYLKERSARPQG